MTDIPTTLANLSGELATLQAGLVTATAAGGKASAVAAATRTAATAIQYLSTRTDAEARQVAADGALVTAALTARNAALATADAARTQGAHPPLADTEAALLKTATAAANGVSEGDLDTKGVAAVTTLDSGIATLGDTERANLQAAQTDLVAKQKTLADARSAALLLLANIQGSAADIAARLATAQADFAEAPPLNAAADDLSHRTAVVAYADYATARASLSNEVATDPDGSVTQAKWTAAANAWLAALADAAAAEELVIERQLALDTKLAEQASKRQTRDTDAVAALTTAFGP